ncbi:MerR family DNA-binding transcriptional regulator [Paenibacillus woosongensis]|uniref:MerR family DNA-binding transcriptional regulator n=1 Tax=Paenibacillus woosongensis TaxID=307580 RepID=A0AA95HY90_9BACL|nr:MerR family DNA-binding transcriptional regulator [Paenibacillus woosongensis]WHX47024.1 MerR family DNA-binding transcriptional regulator [Paenibacillus woosongensis]
MYNAYTPKQIAKQLNVSTTTLRRYEEQGLIPDVPRTASNRRCYTPIHRQAFITIRTLLKGYEIPVVYNSMRKMKQGHAEEALWSINQQLHDIQVEKQRVESILTMIKHADFSKYRNYKITDAMTIGEVAEIAGVNPSAIRHWEKEGLIRSIRNLHNGYRVFTPRELRKIIVISSLRKTVYFIENIKQLLDDLDTKNLASVEKSFELAMRKLNQQLIFQYQGIAEMMIYLQMMNQC